MSDWLGGASHEATPSWVWRAGVCRRQSPANFLGRFSSPDSVGGAAAWAVLAGVGSESEEFCAVEKPRARALRLQGALARTRHPASPVAGRGMGASEERRHRTGPLSDRQRKPRGQGSPTHWVPQKPGVGRGQARWFGRAHHGRRQPAVRPFKRLRVPSGVEGWAHRQWGGCRTEEAGGVGDELGQPCGLLRRSSSARACAIASRREGMSAWAVFQSTCRVTPKYS